ncbi:outer membrane beta-barrel protein [bacterium]|nr:outer membrane beta-barrel protein [bacterium]
MKKSIALLSLALVGLTANAQDNKWWVQGGMNFSSTSVGDDTDGLNLGFSPGVGYMLNENLAVGLQLALTGNSMETDNGSGNTSKMSDNTFGAIPFVRYYKWVGDNFGLYGQLDVAFASGTQKIEVTDQPTVESTLSNFGVGIRPGFQYWFQDQWSVNASVGFLGYESASVDGPQDGDVDEVTTSGFGATLDFSTFNLGFNFHF